MPLPPQQLVVGKMLRFLRLMLVLVSVRPRRLRNSVQSKMLRLKTGTKLNKLLSKHKLYLVNIANVPRISWLPRCLKNVATRSFGV